jgi:hypothetical protein
MQTTLFIGLGWVHPWQVQAFGVKVGRGRDKKIDVRKNGDPLHNTL